MVTREDSTGSRMVNQAMTRRIVFGLSGLQFAQRGHQSINAGLGDLAILLWSSRAAADASGDDAIDEDREAAPHDHETTLIRGLYSERRTTGAGDLRVFMGGFPGTGCGESFIDGYVDAGHSRLIHAHES